MKNAASYIVKVLIAICILNACIEPYDPPIPEEDLHHLVVDGFLDVSGKTATVALTRTLSVKSEEAIPTVSGATVSIEDHNGDLYPLSESAPGVYSAHIADASSEKQYRLRIRTHEQREYISELVSVVQTPPIDSITWAVKDDGIEVAVNTHDPAGAAKHFRWQYAETYEYHANFNSLFHFAGDEIVFRPPDESVFACWKTLHSTEIKVTSTEHLAEAVVSRFPITFIPGASRKLSVKYSILVRQQALTEDAYNYWLSLERSTEHLGGLFDPLPSEVVGNIKNIQNPNETVVGYFSAGTVQEARMFVPRWKLPREITRQWSYPYCKLDTVFLDELDTIYPGSDVIIDEVYGMFGPLIGYSVATRICGDCRALDGVTQKPEFWE